MPEDLRTAVAEQTAIIDEMIASRGCDPPSGRKRERREIQRPGSSSGQAVGHLSEQVDVAVVAGGLLDQMHEHPSQRDRLVPPAQRAPGLCVKVKRRDLAEVLRRGGVAADLHHDPMGPAVVTFRDPDNIQWEFFEQT